MITACSLHETCDTIDDRIALKKYAEYHVRIAESNCDENLAPTEFPHLKVFRLFLNIQSVLKLKMI